MKKQLVKLTKFGFLSVIALVTAVGSAQGQSLAYKLRADIPFDFVVANQKLPAGKYSIGRAIQNSGDSVLLIRSLDGRVHAIRWSTPVESRSLKSKGKFSIATEISTSFPKCGRRGQAQEDNCTSHAASAKSGANWQGTLPRRERRRRRRKQLRRCT